MNQNFLKNKNYNDINSDNIFYRCFLHEDCSNNDKKYIENYEKDKKPIELKNFAYMTINYKNKPVYVTTPIMTNLWKLTKAPWQIYLQFTNLDNDNEMEKFYNFIKKIEDEQLSILGCKKNDYLSQIRQDKEKKYEPNLCVKIPFLYNKFDCEILNDNYSAMSIMNINNFQKMQCDIYIDKIWKFNGNYICKWKCKKIYIR